MSPEPEDADDDATGKLNADAHPNAASEDAAVRTVLARPAPGSAAAGALSTSVTTPPNPPLSTTQQDEVYTRLRQWITVGRFLPGERLKIRNVAADLGVGQMPVRAALQRLAAEGALVNIPHAGVTVPRLSVAEFDDLLQMRMLLEGEAAERGALRLSANHQAAMRALCDAMAAALQRGDAHGYLGPNEDFHVLLYKAAGSPTLFSLIDTLWLKAGPVSNQLFDSPDASDVLNDAHEAMLKALAKGDCVAVRRAVERDIVVAGQFLRKWLRDQGL